MPSNDPMWRAILIAAIGGPFAAFCTAYLTSFFRNRISRGDYARELTMPVLGSWQTYAATLEGRIANLDRHIARCEADTERLRAENQHLRERIERLERQKS